MLRGLIAFLLAAVGAGAQSLSSGGQVACPRSFDDGGVPRLACTCSPEATAEDATVWGTDIYTSDSNLCRAALHAGVIGPDGGGVVATAERGLDSYRASLRNGVTTTSYGPWPTAFRFEGAPAVPAETICPPNMMTAGDAVMGCVCSPEASGDGFVWGTDVYSSDSNPCRAAVHAGIITPRGGRITVRPVPGLSAYQGSTRNGVQTESWGEWDTSFMVEPGK